MRAISLLPLLCLAASGQAKRSLTFADYDSWKAITGQTLSPDGKWLAYGLMPQVGGGDAIVRELETAREIRIPVGAPPEPAAAEGEAEAAPPAPRGPRIVFSPDGRFVLTQTFGKKPQKDGLAVVRLTTGALARIENVKSFAVPESGPAVVAYLEDNAEKRLALRPLDGAASQTFEGVAAYALSSDGATLTAMTGNEVFAIATADGARTVLRSGKAVYAKPVFDLTGSQLAFLADGAIFGWRRGDAAAGEWVKPPAGQTVSEKGSFAFTRNGAALQFGFAAAAKAPAAKPEEDKAVFELWHWKDERVQTMQKARLTAERAKSVPAILHLADKKVVVLGDAEISDVTVSDDASVALGFGDRAYGRLMDFETRYRDIWVLNPRTGERRVAIRKSMGSPALAPDGKWTVYYDQKAWWSMDARSGKVVNLTGALPVSFTDELGDMPGIRRGYGAAGWTKDGAWYLVYDRFDVWALRPDGSETKNVTEGLGRRELISFRVVRPRVDPRDRGIDGAQPLLLAAERETTKESGFYRDSLQGTAEPVRLAMAAKKFSAPVLAKNADVAVLTASRFDEFPDLLITDSAFANFRKLTDANPQQKSLQWGTAELVSYKNTDGVPLQGILYKPENFDPAKKYPLLVYIYERLSGGLHTFVEPSPSHRVNAALYASNGYLVLFPDIAYTPGFPGESALKCVMAAVQRVSDMGFVDERRIGIQGHSWGGYQIAYMVTRTNRFAAAAPGALVANMTSAYDGIRYGSGLPRQSQYERGQSRIGGSLWEYPMRYLENSPLFRADQVKTPLLMLHNDRDDAVPFTQGLEFFLALRRLEKEVYFFNYNGEPHGLRKRANQRDYAIRLFEFFGFFLKDAAKPAWMERGIPYIDREKPESQAWRPSASDRKQ